MIKKYNDYLNEKLSDHITGFNYDDIWDNLLDKEPDDILKTSIDNNFLDGIKLALEMGANSYPLFNYAISKQNLELIKLALEYNTFMDNLKFIVKHASIEIFEYLMINNYIKKYDYDECLDYSIDLNKYEISKILLTYGAKSDRYDKITTKELDISKKISTFDKFKTFINKHKID